MKTTLITCRNVGYISGRRMILDGITCSFKAGQVTTIIGPNGGGKTTLVKLILGIEKPASGAIYHRADLKIGYMPQRITIDPSMPLTVKRFLEDKRALDIVNGRSLLNLDMSTLSGGEMQRVLLAYALQNEPNVLILDEPAQGLDAEGESQLYEQILNYQKEHKCCVILVSHDLNFVMRNTQHVLCVNRHICCEGAPEKVAGTSCFKGMVLPYHHHHNHTHDLKGNPIHG